jgi:hypothetical protein
VDKDSNLENGIRVEMDKFDSVMIEESAEKVSSRKAESVLEEGGEHHNLICIECWDVFPNSRTPVQHRAVREKVIHNELADFNIIHEATMAGEKDRSRMKSELV